MSPRRLIGIAIAAFGLASAPAASADAELYPVGSPVWQAAVAAAGEAWGGLPCGGTVDYAWTALPAGIVGYATWMAPASAPEDASGYSTCRVELNEAIGMTPARLCTALAHELGHLYGHDHVDDPAQLMSPRFGGTLAACDTAMAAFAPEAADEVVVLSTEAGAKPAPRAKRKDANRSKRSRQHRRKARGARASRS